MVHGWPRCRSGTPAARRSVRQAARRQVGRVGAHRRAAAHGRAALPHLGRAQGRGDEVRPGPVGPRGRAAGRADRAVPRPPDGPAGLRAGRCRRRWPTRRSRTPWARTGATSWSRWTRPRPRRRRSGRCTAAGGTTAARSRSRCSTPARPRPCSATCARSPAWPRAWRRCSPASTSSRWSRRSRRAPPTSSTTASRRRRRRPSPTLSAATPRSWSPRSSPSASGCWSVSGWSRRRRWRR